MHAMGKGKQVVVIAGPSGSGETTFTNELVLAYPGKMARAISATTREPRGDEKDGEDYYFFDKETFFDEIQKGNIPEHTFVKERDAYYGSYLPDLQKKLDEGKIVIVNTDRVGADYYKRNHNAETIFIEPKIIEVLRKRIEERDPSVSKHEVDVRILQAMREIVDAAGAYDHVVFNTDGEFAETMTSVVEILKREGYSV